MQNLKGFGGWRTPSGVRTSLIWFPSAFNINRVSVRSEGNEHGPNGRKISRILLPADTTAMSHPAWEASRAGCLYPFVLKGGETPATMWPGRE